MTSKYAGDPAHRHDRAVDALTVQHWTWQDTISALLFALVPGAATMILWLAGWLVRRVG